MPPRSTCASTAKKASTPTPSTTSEWRWACSARPFSRPTAYPFSRLSLLKNGTEAQKKHYLPKLIKDEIRRSISITEPDAGSDASNRRTLAVADSWVINGQKVFSTAADASQMQRKLIANTMGLKIN